MLGFGESGDGSLVEKVDNLTASAGLMVIERTWVRAEGQEGTWGEGVSQGRLLGTSCRLTSQLS